jgi:hypothetical protein
MPALNFTQVKSKNLIQIVNENLIHKSSILSRAFLSYNIICLIFDAQTTGKP